MNRCLEVSDEPEWIIKEKTTLIPPPKPQKLKNLKKKKKKRIVPTADP